MKKIIEILFSLPFVKTDRRLELPRLPTASMKQHQQEDSDENTAEQMTDIMILFIFSHHPLKRQFSTRSQQQSRHEGRKNGRLRIVLPISQKVPSKLLKNYRQTPPQFLIYIQSLKRRAVIAGYSSMALSVCFA